MKQEIMGWQWHLLDHIEGSVHKGSISRNPNFFRKRVFVFCKFYFVILPTRSSNCIDFYTIRIVFESSFQLYIFIVANLKKLWQFWQKYVDRTFVHVKHGAV